MGRRPETLSFNRLDTLRSMLTLCAREIGETIGGRRARESADKASKSSQGPLTTVACGDAQLRLAAAYGSGRGVKPDIVEAAKWYEAAANQGNAEAQNNVRGIGNLGICYDSGIGVAKDQSRAAQQYEEAANAGDLQSMLNIGVDYWHGEGVDKDLAKAYMWFDLVRLYTQAGDANRMLKWRARGALDALSRQITPQIQHVGEALSHAWDHANRDKVQRSSRF
jgi:TPR repeat protein